MGNPSYLPPTPPSEPNKRLAEMTSDADSTVGIASQQQKQQQQPKHIWFITGPAGCGKSSVAEFLHKSFNLPYLEGDAFHTPANVQKMANGQPLTDADRWDWLILLREQSLKSLSSSSSSSAAADSPSGVIVTCSALKRKYRDVLRIAAYHQPHVRVHFVFLKAAESVLMDRVRARQNHYMKDYMVRSQFESLEAPMEDEADVLSVDAAGSEEEVQKLALRVVERVLAGDGGN